MSRITKKEAALAGLGTIGLALIYLFISLLPSYEINFNFLRGVVSPHHAEFVRIQLFRSVGYLKEFTIQFLPNIAAVLVGTVAAYALIIRRSRKYNIFLSVPMSSIAQDEDFASHKAFIINIEERVLRNGKIKSIYNPMKGISRKDLMDLPRVSIEKDLAALDRSAYYVLILPGPLASSVVFEAGYAYARRLPSLYFVKDVNHLPYMMREPQITDAIQIFLYTSEDDITRMLNAFQFDL